MNKTIFSSLLILLTIILFIVGLGAGVVYQSQKDGPQSSKMAVALKQLSSKAIPSIVAFGQISNINGRNLTVSYGGGSVVVEMADNAIIYSYNINMKGQNTPQKVGFSQIKKQSTVSVNSKLLTSGQLEGESVMILPPYISGN